MAEIEAAIAGKYTEVAVSAQGKFSYPTGRAGALALGYDQALFADLPEDALTSFCGVGNPCAIAAIAAGSAVLDIGCGAGFDLIIAARTVGGGGRVCGIDLTPAMLERAQQNIRRTAITSIETLLASSDRIPYPDDTFDVVISNGVINLSPHKLMTFKEIYRVCKPGGRLQFADIILAKDLPDKLAGSPEAWSQ